MRDFVGRGEWGVFGKVDCLMVAFLITRLPYSCLIVGIRVDLGTINLVFRRNLIEMTLI